MRVKLGFCIILLILGCTNAFIKVDPNTQMFIDEAGRVRLFHGVNAVFKLPPFLPELDGFDPSNSLNTQDIAQLQEWGFNAVRLGVMWPGLEPVKGQYNYTYLALVKTLVQNLGKAGIYAILDFHQDLISRYFCGEGMPDWAFPFPFPASAFPIPVSNPLPVDNTTHYPAIDQCLQKTFSAYYLSDAVGQAFQRLYTNTSGLITSLQAYWSLIASNFSTEESVLGYELINEPWPGAVYEHPTLLYPGVADKQNLFPLYKLLNAVIRNVDDQHIIFFEKALTDLVGATGFPSGPGGVGYNDRQAYSYHVYCGGTDKQGNPRHVMVCDGEDYLLYETFMGDLKRLGCGGFMTEFGAMGNSTNSIENIGYLLEMAESHLQSWSYWQYKYYDDLTTTGHGEAFYDENGDLEAGKVRALSRTYAYAIAGIPTSSTFDPSSSKFEFSYILNTNIASPTEIYLNEAWYYANGYKVSITPASLASWSSPSKNIIYIKPSSSAPNGATITVLITQ